MTMIRDKYALGRDKKESERLDAQHALLSKITRNALIHPSIPQQGVLSVADVGTGTGIWLQDVSKLLDKTNSNCYYHGFDISAKQFPETTGKLDFSVQDVTLPFPQEHCNRYDIVHVRLLVAALEVADYKNVISNLSAILKPGGFLQWEEIDEDSYKDSDNPVICELGRGFGVSLAAEGKCWAASAKVSKECTVAGFLDVVRLHYLSSRNSDLRLETESEYTSIIEMLYTACLLRAGEIPDKKAASKRAEELVSLYRSLCADGQSPPLKLMRVVAQKPLLPRLH